ncbi:MAG TPA: DUF1178 family protein [Novosphingobium sp.]|jgi:hypothetical protein|nr:DUF1178 family protein [Novosphingobium sp.]
MIVYDLECRTSGHRFEGWFSSSEDFAAQAARGLVSCPHCGSQDVAKAVMAPNVGRKGNQLSAPVAPGTPAALRPRAGGKLPPEAVQMMQALATIQAEALKASRWVGDSFAEQSRKMHYGEAEAATIHGQATLGEAKELLEEGIAVMPLPFPVAPPDELN